MRLRLALFPTWKVAALGLTLIPLLTLEALNPETRLIGVALAAVVVALVVVPLLRTGVSLSIAPMTIAMAVLVLYAFLLLPKTPLPAYMIERPADWLLGLIVLVAVQVSLQRGSRASHWEDALLVSGLVVSLLACLTAALWYHQWAASNGSLFPLPPSCFRLPGLLLGHANVIAGFLNLLLPIAWVRLATRRGWAARLMLTPLLLLFLATEYFASSRGGWLGGAAGLVVATGLLVWPVAGRFVRALWLQSHAKTIALALLAIVGLSAAGAVAYTLLAHQASCTVHSPVATARSGIWEAAVEIIQSSPILGHGVGAFVVRFAQATQIPPGFSTNHAHNLVLQILAETGVVGLLLAIAAGALGLWGLWPAIRRAFSQADPALAAYLGAFTALLVHHSVDYLFNVTSYLLAVMTLAALVSSHPLSRRQVSIGGRPVGVSMLAASALLVGLAVWAVRGEGPYLNGLQAHRQSDLVGTSSSICLAAREHPDISLFGFQCALATADQAARSDDPALLDAAIDAERSALSGDPFWPIHLANLAGLEWASGQHDQAVADLQVAASRAPYHALISLNLGWMLEQSGRESEALEAYRNALAYDSLLRETPFFAATALRRQTASSFAPSRTLSDSDLLIGEAQEAMTAGHPELALPLLDNAVAANPLSARAYAWRAKALADTGQSNAAWINVQTAIFVDSSSWEALALGAVIAEQTGRMQDAYRLGRALYETLEASSSSASYYAELYRRPYLPYDMVPQLIRAVPTREMLAALELAATSYTQRGQTAEARAARAWMLEE